MSTVSRGAKAGGGTDFNTGQTIDPAENNTDLNTLYTLVNGNLDADNLAANAVGSSEIAAGSVTNAKVSASAAIDVSKLAQTAGQLDSDIVDDSADDATTFNTRTDPLDSAATPSLPTNLEEEWERVRFVLARHGVGIPTKIGDGTNDAAWYDGLVIGPNLVPNGSFLDNQTASPVGYAITGTPTTHQLVDLPATEGYGKYLNIADTTAGGGSVTDGPDWTLAGLRANTLYLVETRLLNTTAEVNLTTTGATGTFGDLDLDTNSTDAHPDSTATDWQTVAGLVETDATPTDLVVSLRPSATEYDYGVAYMSVREVASSRDAEGTGREHRSVRGGNITQTASSSATTASNLRSDTTLTVLIPGPNYQVEIYGRVQGDSNSGGGVASIQDNATGSFASVDSAPLTSGGGAGRSVALFYATGVLDAGDTYSARLSATTNDLGVFGDHRIILKLVRMD